MYESRQKYQININVKTNRAKTQDECTDLQKLRNQYFPSKLWSDLHADNVCVLLYPSCMKLLELSILFPLSVACV